MKALVTGGLGFIGSAMVRSLIEDDEWSVVNVDKVSYSSTFGSVAAAAESPRYSFVETDLADLQATMNVVADVAPDVIMHFAAESHVDRSIDGPGDFVTSNVVGTFHLLQAALGLHREGNLQRFLHVSTDEVFGSLELGSAEMFNEDTHYDPRSPYSATKAASDHLVRAWAETYGLPVSITNCSNNYGPFQFPEKLIPLVAIKASRREPLPVYGRGINVRDWLYVDDHVSAIRRVVDRGEPGRTYAVGGASERSNLEVVHALCDIVDAVVDDGGPPRRELVEFVQDRPGHDLRYAIDASRIRDELGWVPSVDFTTGLEATVRWYLENEDWWRPLLERAASERQGLEAAR